MRKARFTEHQIIDVLKSVEAGRMSAVKPVYQKPVITTGTRSLVVYQPLILKDKRSRG